MKKGENLPLGRRIVAGVMVFAFVLQFLPTIPILKYLTHLISPGVELCQLSEDCTCPAATCQCDHGNDVFFSRYTDIQNGSASLSNNTTVTPVTGLTVTTCPSHRHHADAEMASIGRFILVKIAKIYYLPKMQKKTIDNCQKPKEMFSSEIYHPPEFT